MHVPGSHLEITARAGHFTDSVRKYLAAVEKKTE